jgi:hypothetical protein
MKKAGICGVVRRKHRQTPQDTNAESYLDSIEKFKPATTTNNSRRLTQLYEKNGMVSLRLACIPVAPRLPPMTVKKI